MTEQRPKLTDAQWCLLQRAGGYLGDDPDGVAFRGYAGRLTAARNLKKLGLADLLIVGAGRMPRLLITKAGRAALASHGESENRE